MEIKKNYREKFQAEPEALPNKDEFSSFQKELRLIQRRLDRLTLFLFAVTTGHREKCLGEELTEANKRDLADTLGLGLDQMRKMIGLS
jgi:hypothetical protein